MIRSNWFISRGGRTFYWQWKYFRVQVWFNWWRIPYSVKFSFRPFWSWSKQMETVDAMIHFVYHNGNQTALVLGVTAVLTTLFWRPAQGFVRGYVMRQQRRREVHALLAQGFTDFIIDKRISGEITAEEANEEGFLLLKRTYPTCKDLYPSEELLKERIGKRMKSGMYEPMRKRRNMLTKE